MNIRGGILYPSFGAWWDSGRRSSISGELELLAGSFGFLTKSVYYSLSTENSPNYLNGGY